LHPVHPLALFALMTLGGYVVGGSLVKPWAYLGVIAVQLAVLIACLFVAQQVFRRGVKRGMGLSLRRWTIDTLRGLLAFLAILPVAGITIYVLMLLFPDQVDKNIHPSLQAMAEYGWLWRSVVIASAVVFAPLAEEVLYRGMVQSTLRKYLGQPWPAILATSVFFAISHGQPLHWPVLFILSVVLGYNYERTGRLWPAIVLHAAFNAYNIWVFLQYHAS
jgi:membrane protease YdiL (CAAX protease family)